MTEKMVADICKTVLLLGGAYLLLWFILSLVRILEGVDND